MIEKTITLDDVSLIDFLGVEDRNINELSSAFPKSKIISRGNEIVVKGDTTDVHQIADILNALVDHFHQFGKVTQENVRGYITQEKQEFIADDSADDILIYGTRGTPIKARTANQQKLVQAIRDNDLVFALGPAGTGKTYVSVRALSKSERRQCLQGCCRRQYERGYVRRFGHGRLSIGRELRTSAGPLRVTLTDIHPGSSFDVVLLSPKSDLKEADLAALQYPRDIVLLKEYTFPVAIDGVKFGDLNGDGKTDLVVLTNNYSTYAYDHSGAELWHWAAPEAGTVQRAEFEAPGGVWDFDQDGKAEVIAWRIDQGKEYITMADGVTGQIKHRVEWPTKPLPHVYNNFRTAVAKLHPGYPDSLLVYTDDGTTVSINAYDPTLTLLWSYGHPRLKDYHGHYIYPVDINRDGIDEVFISHVMLDAKGHELWNNYAQFPVNNDHVDSARFLDLNGDGKLELITGQSDVGTVLYDATTGKLLWQRFANHTQKIEAGNYRADIHGPVVVASSRFYFGGLGALLRWFEPDGKRIDIWPNNPIPGNPNFVKGDFRGDGKPQLFWQRFRIEPDGTGTLAFPDEVFHMFDFMGTGNDQVITVSRNGRVAIYGSKDAKSNPTADKKDPVYRAHSISNHTHY